MKRKTLQRNVDPIIDHRKNRPHHLQQSTPYRRPVGKRRSAQWIGYPGRREGQDERLYPSRSSNQLEEATKERLDRKERRLENNNKSFSDKPMEFWKREPCTVEMEHTTYYSITPSLSLFTDGIMAQPRCPPVIIASYSAHIPISQTPLYRANVPADIQEYNQRLFHTS